MDAKLKRLHSPDIHDLMNYKPEDPEKFCFLLQAMVGPEGEDGEESFDIEICTPKWLEDSYDEDDIIIGRHYIIVQKFNYKKLVHTINRFLQNCSGVSWNEVANKVARLGKWEFEDYAD
ncbi:MAG TPA: hypothetical protein EYP35_06735 [Desulfobacterales bacterium]|nr:hypothetical protein [Desulfobacterales bacterium]